LASAYNSSMKTLEEPGAMAVSLTLKRPDRFEAAREAIQAHRKEHHCKVEAMSHQDGRELAVVTRATHSSYVLEIGPALGYSGLQIMSSFGRTGRLDVVEPDREHARLAADWYGRFAAAERARVNNSTVAEVVPALGSLYDLIVLSGFWNELPAVYEHLLRLVRVGGSLLVRAAAATTDEDRAALATLLTRLADDDRLEPSFSPRLERVLATRCR
jgi:predicted O-methyltransferase YrrM